MAGTLDLSTLPRMLLYRFSELNPDMRRDPHAMLDPQRASAPVDRDEVIPALYVTAYGVAKDLLTDSSISRNFEYASPANPVINAVRALNAAVEGEFGKHDSMLVLDDPDHARVRGIVAKAFLARAAQARPMIERVVENALSRLEGRDQFDVVEDYACRVPIHVLGAILGCDEADLPDLRRWTEAGQRAFDPTMGADGAANAIAGRRGIVVAGADTDGEDGQGKSGAVADDRTIARSQMDARHHLKTHKSEVFFDALGDSLQFESRTNVNDIVVVLVAPK